jgi:Leucine-rich repeat (LRR) protein
MKQKSTLVLLALALSLCKPFSITAQVNVQDSLALVDLYNSTDGPNWNNHTNWLTSAPVSSWYGIHVGLKLGQYRVRRIRLDMNNLKGSLPASLGNLTYLNILNLNHNQLSDSIPSELGNLRALDDLNLNDNQLSGTIPAALGHITRISALLLKDNQLSGSIPKELAYTEVRYIDFSNNQLSGHIPTGLGILADTIILSHNQFSGSMPGNLGGYNLQHLDLSGNQLSGTVSVSARNDVLNYLDLSSNQFSGVLYYYVFKNVGLKYLNLSGNQISGNLRLMGKLTNLQYLYLDSNQFTGHLPSALGNLTSLVELDLRLNDFKDTIPSSLGNLKYLRVLNLTHNKLTGSIPASFANLTSIVKLNMGDNKLSGVLPSFLTQLPTLKRLNILHNHFTFDGLETLSQHQFDTLRYYNQRYIRLHQNNNTLSVYAGGTLSNNTYTWFKDGALVATITGDSTFTPLSGGNYNVLVTNAVATELTLKSDTLFYSGNGLRANDLIAHNYNTTFSIYPNPAKATVTVTFNAIGNCTLKLTDISGTALQIKTVMAVKGINVTQLDVSRYATGVYFVSLTNELKQTQTIQLNKQ